MGSLKHVSSGPDSYQGWRTPRVLASRFREEYNLTLDTASDADNTVCTAFYDGSEGSDGLKQPWKAPNGGGVWCNPPYRDPGLWLDKALLEVLVEENTPAAVLLVPAAVGTLWLTKACVNAEVHLFDQRIRFELPPREELPPAYQNTLYKLTKRHGFKPKVSPGGGNALVIIQPQGALGITKMRSATTGDVRLDFTAGYRRV